MDWSLVLEVFYALTGFLLIACGVIVFNDKENKTRFGGAAFWFIIGILFAFGKLLPAEFSGVLILILGVLSAFKQVNAGHIEIISEAFRKENAEKLKSKIFIPSIALALSAFLFAQFLPMIMPPEQASLGGQIAIGLSALVGLIATLILTRVKPQYIVTDGVRIIKQMGPASILPQLLATLGAVFTAAGVGTLIGGMMSSIIPDGNIIIGIIMYCLGMAIFTMIMGNGFAAFAVITVGIGIPFVIMQGGNTAIVGTLGLTAGFCGTLLTPMAANFNIVAANLLETKSQYTIIKYQAPFAIVMLVLHMILMYLLAFNF